MRCLTYYTQDHHQIDSFNSWLGREDIYHDGRLMSSQHRLFGGRHAFVVCENCLQTQYQVNIRLRWPKLTEFDIYRNGKAMLLI